MAERTSNAIRNIIAVGHGGVGKTTLFDQMLFKAGAVTRAGSVDEKNSIFDFTEEEKDRQSSVSGALAYCNWKSSELLLQDVPGYLDFTGPAICGLYGADTALLAIAAPSGIELNTRKMWNLSRDLGCARMIVITKMDGDNIVDYEGLIAKIQELFGGECLPVNLPVGIGHDFKGVVSVLTVPEQVPAGVVGDVAAASAALMEKVVESDEALMERYLNDERLSSDEIRAALKKAILQGGLVPILHVSGRSGAGVEELMDFVEGYAPSAADMPEFAAKDASGADVAVKPDPSAPFVGRVIKTLTDPFVGKLSFFRVYQGTVAADSHVHNVRSDRDERMAQIFRPFGKETKPVNAAVPGDIVAVSKIEDMHIGDTLCASGASISLPEMKFPKPMASVAVEPKARGDEQKISSGVQKLADEDPTVVVHRDQQTGELIVTGMSQLHLDILLHRLQSRFGIGVNTKPPQIPYKETITVPSEANYRHKKQSGGRGQFGEVWFKLEPLERGAGFEFVDAVVGGAIPNQYIPAVEKGVRETLAKGVLAGCKVEDVRVILHFGKYHDVDSSEAAFKLAASMCFHEAFMKAKPVLLEPVVNMEITVPSQHMGDISGDLNSRRGRIVGMDSEDDLQVIRAVAPLSEVMNYATELRSMTGGTGSYAMEFSHYDIVPARTAEQVIAKAKKAKEEAHGR